MKFAFLADMVIINEIDLMAIIVEHRMVTTTETEITVTEIETEIEGALTKEGNLK